EVEELLALAAVSRVDEGADIDIAPGHHTRKRSVNVLEGLQLLQPAHVGFSGGMVCLGLLVSAGLLVGFLLRDRICLAQVGPTFGKALGQLKLGLNLLAGGAGL